jgi:hypothetical protein
MDYESFKLYKGISLDALAAFANVTGLSKKNLYQEFYKLATANHSALKRLIQREGIAGYNEDLQRVLAAFITSSARLASRNIHLGEASEAVQAIPKHMGKVREAAAQLVGYVQNPTEEVPALRGYLFVNFLGGSIASALVNATQPVLMTAPWLSQYSNPLAAAKALALAVGKPNASETGLIAAMARAAQEGVTEPQEIHQLYAEAIRTGVGNNLYLRKLAKLWAAPFSLAESFNRRVTFEAAYRLADSQGMTAINAARARQGLPTVATPYDFAIAAVEETQGVYNRGNRPDLARGPIGATVFTFKQFTIAYLEFLSRLPTREKGIALALLVLASGIQGAPGAEDLEDLIDTIGQMLGFNTNSKKAVRQWAINTLGKEYAGFVTQGVSGIPGSPLDFSQRLGMGNILPGTSLLKRSEEGATGKDFAETLGPAAGVVNQLAQGFHALEDKEYGRAARSVLPMALQNLAQGLDMHQSGFYRDSHGRHVVRVDDVDAFVKGTGFQPYNVAQANEAYGLVMQDTSLHKNVETSIVERIARGAVDQDPEQMNRARADQMAWNQRNPDAPVIITPRQIQERVRGSCRSARCAW